MNKTVIGSVAAMVVIAVVALMMVSRALAPTPQAQPEGTVVPAAPEATAVLDVVQRPDCPAGALVDLSCLGGDSTVPAQRVQIYNVWAWWCEPCRAELPLLEAVAARNGWQLVGVHADASAAKGAALLADLGVDMPSYQDSNGTFAGTLGLPGVIPITVVAVDGHVQGQLVKAFDAEEELEQAIKEYL
ncbi:hypothetical protein CPHO_01115 [Corynebacterium phocae]|uniref:Thioredoxin domain-containing protein n=1 Tax=Corynebacterium phocae TaxID=161895 RepID=A0A1L7D1B1_9CORY|nr:TlpA disulfide reductase family protein [Corynebacterium phocae]APT91751.1 hypothetical protein CPHO_01115 [Corynebacterium phocae]KAA8728515.1 TlpA family protein disulfide reductase [Corynebacterium phocae]